MLVVPALRAAALVAAVLLAAAAKRTPTPAVPAGTPRPTAPPTPTPVPGQLHVTVTLVADGKKAPEPNAVVWLPGSGPPANGAPPRAARVASQNKRFEPRIQAVPAGSTVDFPNLDRIFHNVFSLSEKAKFDLGLYKNGASKPFKFANPGLVRIYCNIHPQMAAFVMVVDGGNYAITGPDGTALLQGIPPGRKSVKVWDERGGEWSGGVEILAGSTAALPVLLDAGAFHEIPHKNKYGKEYPPPDDDENRY